jgi:hypothetical protein
MGVAGMWGGLIAGLGCAALLLGLRLHRRTRLVPVRAGGLVRGGA